MLGHRPVFLTVFSGLAALFCATPVAALSPSQLIVFGDSLSDVGNVGRATASYLWGEHVAGGFGLRLRPSKAGGTDYAYGGAWVTAGSAAVPSLPQQVQRYLTVHAHADGSAVYVIWGGGNDVLSTIGQGGGHGGLVQTGVAATLGMVRTLYAAGARRFVVGDVPRTDLTPYVRGLGQAAMAEQSALVQAWNGALRAGLSGLHLPGAEVTFYDASIVLPAVTASPTHYGFTNWTTPCGDRCADPAHTFFWDEIHPGETGHVLIAGGILALIRQ